MRSGLGFVPVLVLVLDLVVVARADDLDDAPPPPRWHASAAVGGSLLLTGDAGDSSRLDGAISFQFAGKKLGLLVAARHFDDEPRDILLTAGVEYQAAASRPRLVLTLYADAGVETAGTHPVLGFGTRTTFRIIGPLAVIGDTGFHLVFDGLDDTTLIIGSALMIGVAR